MNSHVKSFIRVCDIGPYVGRLLENMGFEADTILPYWRLDFKEAIKGMDAKHVSGINIRGIDKTHLRREVSIIHPLITQSIAKLDYCGGFTLDDL